MKSSLLWRFMLPTASIITVLALLFGVMAWRINSRSIHLQAASEAELHISAIAEQLQAVDSLSRQQVESSMQVLRDRADLLGKPSLVGTTFVAGHSVPDLHLGRASIVNNFQLVDQLQQLTNATATLFVVSGQDYFRVSTNVLKTDGSRAVGTVLDPKGKAYAAITQGRSFSGVVDILGSPYMTSYQPMQDAAGKTIGVWYVGYPLKTLGALGDSIASHRILDHGYLALLRSNGSVLFSRRGVLPQEVEQRLNSGSGNGWSVRSSTFAPWGYKLLAVYPDQDVQERLWKMLFGLTCSTALLLLLVMLLQFFLLRRLVVAPVIAVGHSLRNADLNTVLDEKSRDEIGDLSRDFNRFVLGIRNTLLSVLESSSEATSRSERIRAIASDSVDRAGTQHSQMEHLSQSLLSMTTSFESIHRGTQSVAEQARAAAGAARTSGDFVNSAVSEMDAISKTTEQIVARIQALGQRSENIREIVSVIEEIAVSTNMLALNASIEAARAGEHGRGFGVVASEVRRLAERTAAATQQVSERITAITSETSSAIAEMCLSRDLVQRGVAIVRNAGNSIEEIITLAASVDQSVQQIATASTEEYRMTCELNQEVLGIAKATEETAEGAQHVVTASAQLLSTASGLEQSVSKFHLVSAA
jgi:methyl-accepting chemotaxis protein